MALVLGTRVGVYEVTAPIGEGGMGQVYRARDTRLNRDVALKILPDAFARDPDRLARFTREAQTLASLNHPNIGAIYGIEESGDVRALVMELVEGEDLSQRIARGAIPLDETLQIGRQIADALEAAHEQGIIHRDLKPANIKLRPDGTVKVLDFGLAKAMEPASATSVNAMASPTLSMHATQAGIILGTAAYMSPEQAAGKPVDKRSDLWAFGVVLMEMLTGRPVFAGETVSHVLASVLRAEPDWTTLPAGTPAPIRKLLRRCLEKDRKRRIADAADARLEIDEALAPIGDASAVRATMRGVGWPRALPWAIAGALAAGLAAVVVLWAPWRKASPPATLRLEATLGADAPLVIAAGGAGAQAGNAIDVAPDGSQLAFVAQPHGGGAPRIYIRRLDQLTATPLAGTEDAVGPFFSADGQWLGFFAAGKLKKIAVTGGAPMALADAPNARGGNWAEDGTIVFTANSPGGYVWRVSEGGTAERLTTLAAGEATHRWPQVLPGGRGVLYTVSAVTGNFANAWLAVQPLPTGTPHIVQRGGSYGRYLRSGHLTWVHDGTLFAAPFDLATLAVTGPAVPVLAGVQTSTNSGNAQVGVSANGTLAYVSGDEAMAAAPLDWLTRDGKATPLRATLTNWSGVQIAPDGRRLAFSLLDPSNTDVWTYDVARDSPTRLTVDAGTRRAPVWTPDGRRLVYAASSSGIGQNLYWQRADGGGNATRLTTSPNQQYPGSWHPSGRFLAFSEIRQTGAALLILPIDGDEASGWKPGMPTVFLSGSSTQQQPRFSPDGQWLAYESTESGPLEIYVRPFPGPGGRSQVSTGGGSNAVWSRVRHELLYRAPDGRIMVVPYAVADDQFQVEKPRVWSETPIQLRPSIGASFDLHPDGERVVMAPATATSAGPTHVTLIFNFFDELRRMAPPGRR